MSLPTGNKQPLKTRETCVKTFNLRLNTENDIMTVLREFGAFLFANKQPLFCEASRLPKQGRGNHRTAVLCLDMKEIPLTFGQVALIDDSDFELVSQYRWYANRSRRVGGYWSYYATSSRKVNGHPEIVRMHRLVMGACLGQIVDHINRNSLDNRKENLRFVTARENSLNRSTRILQLDNFVINNNVPVEQQLRLALEMIASMSHTIHTLKEKLGQIREISSL